MLGRLVPLSLPWGHWVMALGNPGPCLLQLPPQFPSVSTQIMKVFFFPPSNWEKVHSNLPVERVAL